MGEHIDQALADLGGGAAVDAVAIALLVKALQAMPGRIVAFAASGELDTLLAASNADGTPLIRVWLISLVEAVLAGLSPQAREIATGLAKDWDRNLLDLLEAAEALAED